MVLKSNLRQNNFKSLLKEFNKKEKSFFKMVHHTRCTREDPILSTSYLVCLLFGNYKAYTDRRHSKIVK